MIAATLITLVLILSINLVNTAQVSRHLDEVLQEMSVDSFRMLDGFNKKGRRGDNRRSALNQYSGRFYCVRISSQGQTLAAGQDIPDGMEALANQIAESGKEKGSLDSYRFLVRSDDVMKSVFLLDCVEEAEEQKSLLLISAVIGAAGILICFIFIYLMSGRIVLPLKESMEKQKRFITDAGHELKTPLSVIGTNMDILTMDLGKNEWVEGTKKQVKKLRRLVSDLISLARMDEGSTPVELAVFDISSAAEESVIPFGEMASLQGKHMSPEITQGLSAEGDEASIRQLFTILCDNAVKYSTAGSAIRVRLFKDGRKICFETANSWDREHAPAKLEDFFGRFYRGDKSRDRRSKDAGYGLGLSIAEGIAQRNHIQLKVFENSQEQLIFQALFDQRK